MSFTDHRRIDSITVSVIDDPEGDSSYLSQTEDADRLAALQRGDWGYVGVRATADVTMTGSVMQGINSGGVWSVESDSGIDHLQKIAEEEIDLLREELRAAGFEQAMIDAADISYPADW